MTILDDKLFGGDQPLNRASGYTWIESIDAGTRTSQISGVALLLHEVQKHSEEFENGGYVLFFDDRLAEAVTEEPSTEVDDIPDFATELVWQLRDVLPGLDRIDANADTALLLSIYGKVCSKLPEHTRARLITADVQTGIAAVFNQERPRTRLEVLKEAISGKGAPDPSPLTVREVADAALSTVNAYTRHLENEEMAIADEATYYIKDVVVKLRTALIAEGASVDDVDTVMFRFERAAADSADYTETPVKGTRPRLVVDNTVDRSADGPAL